nr:uncharacterized protein LOC109189836 [Ipomoea batatas]
MVFSYVTVWDLGGSREPVAADQPCGGADPVPEVNNVIVAQHVSGVGLDGTCVGNGDCVRIVDEMDLGGSREPCCCRSAVWWGYPVPGNMSHTIVQFCLDGWIGLFASYTALQNIAPLSGFFYNTCRGPFVPAPDSIRHVWHRTTVHCRPSDVLDDVQLSIDLGGSREPVAADQPCGGADPVPEVNNVIVAEHGVSRVVGTSICAAPLKANRPIRPAPDSIRHVGIGSTVPLPPSDVLDDVQLSKWIDHVQFSTETPDKALVERFSKALEADLALSPYTDLRDVRLLFFPMLQSNHYYLLCVDFFSSRFHIIDNTTRCPSTKSKYGHIPDNLLLLLAGYFRSLKHLAKAEWCLHFEPKRMTMKWRDANNTIDCGVYLMRHMESYAGQLGLGWDCGLIKGDQATLDRFRLQYIQDICTANINSHRTSNVARAIQYLSSLGDTR